MNLRVARCHFQRHLVSGHRLLRLAQFFEDDPQAVPPAGVHRIDLDGLPEPFGARFLLSQNEQDSCQSVANIRIRPPDHQRLAVRLQGVKEPLLPFGLVRPPIPLLRRHLGSNSAARRPSLSPEIEIRPGRNGRSGDHPPGGPAVRHFLPGWLAEAWHGLSHAPPRSTRRTPALVIHRFSFAPCTAPCSIAPVGPKGRAPCRGRAAGPATGSTEAD